MYAARKQTNFDGPSYYQDASRKYYREDSVQGLRLKLSSNLQKIVELFVERKQLIKKLVEIMMAQNSAKLQHISKAKNNDLRNEARQLKDEMALNLIQNAEKYSNGNKNMLRIITQANIKSLEQDHSKRLKSYYDQIKRIDTDRLSNISKFKSQSNEISKLNDEERKLFRDIELLEQNKINVLTSKAQDHIRIAEKIQDEIERNKLVLKNIKNNKEKKKRELAFEIDKIMEATKRHQLIATNRYNQIVEMFAGYQNLSQFDNFYTSFETVVRNKVDAKKQDEAIVIEIVRRTTLYEKQAEEIQRNANDENELLGYLFEAYRKNVTLALLQKAYLSNIPNDKNSLMSIVSKFQAYRQFLDKLADQKEKTKWETQKAHQVLDHFEPILKSINTEEKRRQQLKQRIAKVMNWQIELEKMEKKQQNFQFQLTNLLLQKQAISKPMQEAARKGNLQQYKIKVAQLQKIEQEIQAFTQSKNDSRYKQEKAKLNMEIQQINREYCSIIDEILAGEKEMSFSNFLQKLSKRLMLV